MPVDPVVMQPRVDTVLAKFETCMPRPISAAKKDGRPILGFCVHDADPYFDQERDRLTSYGAHCEGLSHVPDGWHVVEWSPGGSETSDSDGRVIEFPDCWCRSGSDGEEVANPTHWLPVPVGFDPKAKDFAAANGPS